MEIPRRSIDHKLQIKKKVEKKSEKFSTRPWDVEFSRKPNSHSYVIQLSINYAHD